MPALSTVLIVDDEPAVRDLMVRWVASLGLEPAAASSADEALATLRAKRCDLAVLDVMMPGHDGLWLAAQMQRDYPHTAVIIATAYTELLRPEAPHPTVADLLVKPFQQERFALALERGRQWRKQALEELQWHALLSQELRERVEELCAALAARDDQHAEDWLLDVMSSRTPSVHAHCRRVAEHAEAVARELSLDPDDAVSLLRAARLHDIGKAAMPEALLTKPSPLSSSETAIMRRHVEAGADILACSAALAPIAPIVLASHEWFGGGGFPLGLAGTAIPRASRIIAVIDAYDTMTESDKEIVSEGPTGAVAELLRRGHSQFDPDALEAFLAVLGKR